MRGGDIVDRYNDIGAGALSAGGVLRGALANESIN